MLLLFYARALSYMTADRYSDMKISFRKDLRVFYIRISDKCVSVMAEF